MKCIVRVYLLNELFSQEFANEYHNGKESADNKKYLWEDELSINSEVTHAEEKNNAVYSIKGTLPNGTSFSEDVESMRIVKILSENAPPCEIGVSESILDSLSIISKEKEIIIDIFIKDNEPLANPVPGIYIASKEFPKNLIF